MGLGSPVDEKAAPYQPSPAKANGALRAGSGVQEAPLLAFEHVSKVYRIYTEDLNRADVLRLAAAKFENFTLQPITGCFRGKAEDSIVIEIVQAQEKDVAELAKRVFVG